MIVADLIAIILIALFCLLGLWLGFGKGLSFFTKGIFGVIISVFVCYCFGGFILKISFVNNLVLDLNQKMSEGGGFLKFLADIHFEMIVYYIVLFIITLILRAIIVKIIKSVVEVKNVFMKVINKTLGMVFFVGVLVMFTLIAFQIVQAIGGSTAESFAASLKGSFFKLDELYLNNPLMVIIEIFTFRFEYTVPVT